MPELLDVSRRLILRYQQPTGAYPACPNMPDYQFCWFRDGSFIAHSMLISGEVASAAAFHRWAATAALRYADGARRAMADFAAGRAPNPHDVLRARYTYTWEKGPDDWPEFQLDGLGTWLWALRAFVDAGQSLAAEVRQGAELAADYLAALWQSPCHDLWEEFGDQVHTYTLASIYAGLAAAADFLLRPALKDVAASIKTYILENCTAPDGSFVKSVGSDLVDGSLSALAIPYRVVEPDDPRMVATMRRVEAELYAPGCGVHRYVRDVYYGGGAWLLLAAWLGWYEADRGDTAKAVAILAGIERQATAGGELPEQVVPPMLADASNYDHWVEVRGPIALPLLWSHAMLLILARACEKAGV
jgi:GH15 family glucan-1,4-alpha-glucosidase